MLGKRRLLQLECQFHGPWVPKLHSANAITPLFKQLQRCIKLRERWNHFIRRMVDRQIAVKSIHAISFQVDRLYECYGLDKAQRDRQKLGINRTRMAKISSRPSIISQVNSSLVHQEKWA